MFGALDYSAILMGNKECPAFPLLMHVADPEEFWSKETAPAWAVTNGWYYTDRHPSKESLYTQEKKSI